MTILLTGGTGKTSLRLASLLHSASIPVLLTSRRGPSASSAYPTIRFDWNDSTTWSNAFSTASDISAVYLLSGELSDPAPIINAFIDLAMSKGVKRFVVCSGSSCEYGGPFHGKIWQKLDESKLEYAVLRPSWFMGKRRLSFSFPLPFPGYYLSRSMLMLPLTTRESLGTRTRTLRNHHQPLFPLHCMRRWENPLGIRNRYSRSSFPLPHR